MQTNPVKREAEKGCWVVTHCGRQPDSESVYCCCIHSVHECEQEVGRVAEGAAVAWAAEVEAGSGLEFGGSSPGPAETQTGGGHSRDRLAMAALHWN